MVASTQQSDAVADDLGADPVSRRSLTLRRDPMAMESAPGRWDPQIRRAPNASGLYDVLDLILDKGIVIDAFVRVSLVGIEVLTLDARVVIASVDTYLRYAEGVERLNWNQRSGAKKLPDMVGQGAKSGMMASGAKKLGNALKGGDDEDEKGGDDEDEKGGGDEERGEKGEGLGGALTRGVRHILQKGVGGILHNVKGDRHGGEDDEDQGQRQGRHGRHDDEENEADEREQRQPARSQQRNGNAGRAKAGSRR